MKDIYWVWVNTFATLLLLFHYAYFAMLFWFLHFVVAALCHGKLFISTTLSGAVVVLWHWRLPRKSGSEIFNLYFKLLYICIIHAHRLLESCQTVERMRVSNTHEFMKSLVFFKSVYLSLSNWSNLNVDITLIQSWCYFAFTTNRL